MYGADPGMIMKMQLETPPRQTARSSMERVASARILYVEDEPVTRNMCELVLTRAGYSVTTAADGLEGWTTLTSEQFALVITDNHMPHLTGMQLVTRARANGISVPFIVASGSIEAFAAVENRWLRLAALIQKPFGPDDLVATVREVLAAEVRKPYTRPVATSSGGPSDRSPRVLSAV